MIAARNDGRCAQDLGWPRGEAAWRGEDIVNQTKEMPGIAILPIFLWSVDTSNPIRSDWTRLNFAGADDKGFSSESAYTIAS